MTSTGDSSLDDLESVLKLEVTESSVTDKSEEDLNDSLSGRDHNNSEENEYIAVKQKEIEKFREKTSKKQRIAPKIDKKAAAIAEKVALPTTSSATKTSSSSSAAKTKGKLLTKPRTVNKEIKMAKVGTANKLTTKNMIIQAVANLNNKKGSSTTAIKKYMIDKYDISDQRARMITKLLRTADEEGWLSQTAGTGASSGSYFKLTAEMKKDIQNLEKKKQAIIKKEEKIKIKSKEATKRKTEKKIINKEVLTKKKKIDEVSKKKVAVTKKKAA